jgi:hypothetical protein
VSRWDITIAVCNGILLAGLVSACISALLMVAYMHGLRLEMDRVFADMSKPRASYLPPELTSQPRPPVPEVAQQHLVTVPAKSVEDCLAASNGVADMAYAKCRQTHQELRY